MSATVIPFPGKTQSAPEKEAPKGRPRRERMRRAKMKTHAEMMHALSAINALLAHTLARAGELSPASIVKNLSVAQELCGGVQSCLRGKERARLKAGRLASTKQSMVSTLMAATDPRDHHLIAKAACFTFETLDDLARIASALGQGDEVTSD